jgi:hypothetical protein
MQRVAILWAVFVRRDDQDRASNLLAGGLIPEGKR